MNGYSARAAPVAAEVLRANVIIGRARSRLSQQQLAERAGVSRPTISRIERAIGDVSLDVIERLARALDIPVYSLLTPGPEDRPVTDADLERRATAPETEFVDVAALGIAMDEAEGRRSRYSAAGRPRLGR